jgi:glycosyltransferase involved in cell wall biosynthesis
VLTAGQETGPSIVSRTDGPVCVRELRVPGGDFGVYRTETYWLGYTWAVLGALRTLAEARPYDVIDFPDYAAEGFAFQLDRVEDDRAAVVVHLHGSLQMFAERIGWPEPGDPLHHLGTFMEATSIAGADRLLAASRSIAEFTAARAEIPHEQIDVVEGAVDSVAFAPADPRAGNAGDGPARDRPVRLLFVGNLTENKGVHTVFGAFLRLAPGHPGLSLVVAGAGDDHIAESMRAEAAAAGLGDRLEILGFVEHEQLPGLYRSADLLAAPSQFEGGLGMVYLEAMACGVPVIAAAAGGAAEAVVDGETGILLERGDSEATTAAIAELLADPARRARMGAAARLHVEHHFSPERYAERVAAAYERAIERRRSSLTTWSA